MKGPRGEKRPADTNACAVMVGKIATGEITDDIKPPSNRAKGGRARKDALTPGQRKAIAKKAAQARWKN